MVSREEWKTLIGMAPREFVTQAHTYRSNFTSYTMPVLLGCHDGHDYVVKSATQPELFRVLCSDQIMGHIAMTIGAPAPVVRLVEIPQELIEGEPEMAKIPAGIAHGSRYLKNVSKIRQGIQFQNVPENRSRFALLSIMYGLAGVDGDHQFFYEDSTNIVWSFDHGHFFHSGPCWTIETLRATPAAVPDPVIAIGCGLAVEELTEAAKCLVHLMDEAIAFAVASPEDAWQIMMDERIALAEHFRSRADDLAI